MKTRRYGDLMQYSTFEDRFNALLRDDTVCSETFGAKRSINQQFYMSHMWKEARKQAIIRDNGCDLGIQDRKITGIVHVHHIEPIRPEWFVKMDSRLCDLSNLITCSAETHRAIHFGSIDHVIKDYVPRKPGDTKLW